MIVKRSRSVQWKRKIFDLSQEKLATLRASHGRTIAQTAEHLGFSEKATKDRVIEKLGSNYEKNHDGLIYRFPWKAIESGHFKCWWTFEL